MNYPFARLSLSHGKHAIQFITLSFASMIIYGCGEHAGKDIKLFTGEYHYQAGIGQFFDCASAKAYYVFDSSAHAELQTAYQALNLKQRGDAYLHVEGYLELIPQMDGVDPAMEFIPTKLVSIDPDRGCTQSHLQGG